MDTTRPSGNDLLDVVRVLLLVQGSILLATTLEALFWSAAFAGGAGTAAVLSAAAAVTLFVARARVRAERRWTRRLVYLVEGALLAMLALDALLAALFIGGTPPLVAILTRLAFPLSVIALLRRSARMSTATTPTAIAEGAV